MANAYKDAGVDIQMGNDFVRSIKANVKSTFTINTVTDIGGFGAVTSLRSIGEPNICLVSSIDGVGTKTRIARIWKKNTKGNNLLGLGKDIVNHCVNDVLAMGAKPLFFMDYLGVSRLDIEEQSEIIEGMAFACRENECALVGGETAEMSYVYKESEFDVVGSIVGIVKRDRILDGSKIKAGDIIIGLRSDGLHTNGYSIVNKLYDEGKIRFADGCITAAELVVPHKSYYKYLKESLSFGIINGIAHITGGGFDNILRIIPKGLGVDILGGSWAIPKIFSTIQRLASIDYEEMFSVFNMGIGMVVIINPKNFGEIIENGLLFGSFYVIGQIVNRNDRKINFILD
jgi:phosphoribosylformylglycinamidine cyclo-ligase